MLIFCNRISITDDCSWTFVITCEYIIFVSLENKLLFFGVADKNLFLKIS